MTATKPTTPLSPSEKQSINALLAEGHRRALESDSQARRNGEQLAAVLKDMPTKPVKTPPAPESHFKEKTLPLLRISVLAWAKMTWSISKSHDEFSFWGVIEKTEGGFVMVDADLNKHTSNQAYSDPDMEWYGDWLTDQVADNGRQPWQLACWIHTHPTGVNGPSGTDEETFKKNFGDQRLAFMVIMTKEKHVYARLSAIVEPIDGIGVKTYTASPMRVEFEDPQAQADAELKAKLDAAYPELVSTYDFEMDFGNPATDHRTRAQMSRDTGFYAYDDDDDDLALRHWLREQGAYDAPKIGRRCLGGQERYGYMRRASAPKRHKNNATLLEHADLVEYLASFASLFDEYDMVTFEEATMLDLATIAEHCCVDVDLATIWLASRIRQQIALAMIDPKIKEEVANVIRYGDCAGPAH